MQSTEQPGISYAASWLPPGSPQCFGPVRNGGSPPRLKSAFHPLRTFRSSATTCSEEATSVASVRSYLADDFQGVRKLWEEVFPNDPPWNHADTAIPAKTALQPEL